MPIERIPVVLLTGFLGSGKTTLLRALLRHPQWQRTAVLINEIGAVGLDHHLAWGAADSTLLLDNGCICCSVQTDLAASLEQLFWDRLQRRIPRFDRVVIETTGIADPARIVGLFSGGGLVAERYALAAVVCTVDGTEGPSQLQRHPESASQVALADAVLITKTDLADAATVERLAARIATLNCAATVLRGSGDNATQIAALLPCASGVVEDRTDPVAAGGATPRPATASPLAAAHAGIATIVLRPAPFATLDALRATLEQLLRRLHPQLLRVKGIVEVVGDDRPWVVQAVSQRLHELERLPGGRGWTDRGCLVVIARDLSREELRAACGAD